MSDKHLSSEFDADLVRMSTRLLAMGGLVEQQVTRAVASLARFDAGKLRAILEDEGRVNLAEREIDEALGQIIARRQPAARDLRLLMAVSKCTTNLERAADEARKVAKRGKRINEQRGLDGFKTPEVFRAGRLASELLHKALDAFARMDTAAAIEVMDEDYAIERNFAPSRNE